MKNQGRKTRNTIWEKILYYFDIWLSKGTLPMITLLFGVTGLFVLIIGVLTMVFGGQDYTLGRSLWDTMNHAFDPGVLSGDSGNKVFLFLMLVATVIGVLFLAILIGLVNDGIQERVSNLSKGIEAVIEENHVVILGFNESTFIILNELIGAYQNQRTTRNVVVVMDQKEKTEMEDRIRIEFPDPGNLEIICRSGSIYNPKDLHRCSILTCKSIIIASDADFETIKSILACTMILNESEDSKAYVTSAIYGRENEHAARIAGNDSSEDPYLFSVKSDRLELLMMENTTSKIMTHTCRHNGLSTVFTELFNFEGHEFYVPAPEDNKKLYAMAEGRSIRQINRCLTNEIAVGIIKEDGDILIDDPNTVILERGCRLVLLQEDDDTVVPGEERIPHYEPPTVSYKPEPSSILIIGCNEKLPYVLREMCKYLIPGTSVYLSADADELDQWLTDEIIWEMIENDIESAIRIQRKDNVEGTGKELKQKEEKLNIHKKIYRLLSECNPQYVLILLPDSVEPDKADEEVLKLLLYCNNYKNLHPEADFGITCEMNSVANQQLAQRSMASDFVISQNIASLMMSQIAENRDLRKVFETLLSSEGYEVYIKPARYYFHMDPDREIDYYSIQDAVADKGEIFLGYKKTSPDGSIILLNPQKVTDGQETGIILTDKDELVVLAQDMTIRS